MRTPRLIAVLTAVIALGAVTPSAIAHAAVGDITVASQGADGATPVGNGSDYGAISANRRFVVFQTYDDNLLTNDPNADAYRTRGLMVRDLQLGTTSFVASGFNPAISGDGCRIVWESPIVLKDQCAGFTRPIGEGHLPQISRDGRYVVFQTQPGGADVVGQVYRYDILTGAQTMVSTTSGGTAADGRSEGADVSSDGRYVSFDSQATNLVAKPARNLGVQNQDYDVYVKDMLTGAVTLASVDDHGVIGDQPSFAGAGLSGDGRFIAFYSGATNFAGVPPKVDAFGNRIYLFQVYLHDRLTGRTELVSQSDAGTPANDTAEYDEISLTDDGRFVAFVSYAGNLVPGDSGSSADVFVRDRSLGTTTRVNIGTDGTIPDRDAYRQDLTPDGSEIVFTSYSNNLPPFRTDHRGEVLVKELATPPAAHVVDDSYPTARDTPLSVPAASGVLANDVPPPSGPLSATLVQPAAVGTVDLHADGSFDYTPPKVFNTCGFVDQFLYQAANGGVVLGPATVRIHLTCPSKLTLRVPDSIPGSGLVRFRARLVDATTGLPLGGTVRFRYGTVSGSASTDPNGVAVFAADITGAGPGHLNLEAAFDGDNTYSPSTAVKALNRKPVVTAATPATVPWGVGLTLPVSVVDPDGDPVTTTFSGPAGSQLDASGLLTWTPTATDIGTTKAFVTVTDDIGPAVTKSIPIVVTRHATHLVLTGDTQHLLGTTTTCFARTTLIDDVTGEAMGNRSITATLAGSTLNATTAATDGTASFDCALPLTPRSTTLKATYGGAAEYFPAVASEPFAFHAYKLIVSAPKVFGSNLSSWMMMRHMVGGNGPFATAEVSMDPFGSSSFAVPPDGTAFEGAYIGTAQFLPTTLYTTGVGPDPSGIRMSSITGGAIPAPDTALNPFNPSGFSIVGNLAFTKSDGTVVSGPVQVTIAYK